MSTSRKVFIVNQPDATRAPAGRDPWDVSPAAFFGEIIYLFEITDPPPVRNREAAMQRAHEVLSQAQKGDAIVWAGGDPFGMVIAAAILAEYTEGEFTYLLWDRQAGSYAPVSLELFADGYYPPADEGPEDASNG